MSDSYDFNATYGKLKVYDQVVSGPCWTFANDLAICASVLMHTGHQPIWPDDGASYPKLDHYGYDGVNWDSWENEHFETTIEGVRHSLKNDQTVWDFKDPATLKAHLDGAGFVVLSSYIPRSFSVSPAYGFAMPVIRGYADDEESGETHAYLGVGYTTEGLIVQNQWGLTWGNEGRAILTWFWWEKWGLSADRLLIDSYPLLGATKAPQPPSWKEEDMKLLAKRTPTSSAVWAFDPGFRSWVYTREVLPAMGLSMDDVKIIPATHPIWKLPVVGNKPPVDD